MASRFLNHKRIAKKIAEHDLRCSTTLINELDEKIDSMIEVAILVAKNEGSKTTMARHLNPKTKRLVRLSPAKARQGSVGKNESSS